VSAGVLGGNPGLAAFTYDGHVVGFAVTDEHTPGVASPSRTPLAAGNVA
jgi:hypothetical protein